VTDAANGQVNFQFDSFGLLKQATDPANNVVSQVSYNVRGMRTQLADMDLGTWNYTPNALGEVTSQTDAKGQTTSFVFDALGRPSTRTESEGTTTWTWGTAADNTASNKYIGQLKSVSGPGYAESFVFDALSRPLTRTITSDAAYQFDYSYNNIGQLNTLTYPTSTSGVRFKTKFGYTAGYLTSVQDFTGNVNGTVLWNLNLLDARLNAISETYGNGLWLQNGFDAATGEPLTRQAGTGGQANNVQNLSYVWDDAGNLSSRQDLRQALTESFTYDALDRLTLASGPAAQSTSIAYDAIGNISSKTGVGSYTYHATRKHAVVSAGGASYSYDGNGNLISRSGATVTWSSYNLPTYLADPSGYFAQFWYAPDRSRWKQVSSYAGATETTIYVGGLLEKFTNATATHWKHLIPTPSGQVQVIRRSSGVNDTLYVTTDHLGSTDAVLNAAGAVLMRGSFDVHGKRRAGNWQGAPSSTEWQAIAATTRRGYTGHEQLDNVMLIHMNGRVFDPVMGRFLSADPFIDGPETTQGWNRYAYVQGRLMSATDPSGFDAEGRARRLAEVSEELARDNATMAWLIQWGSSYADYGHMAPMWSFSGRDWVLMNMHPKWRQFTTADGMLAGSPDFAGHWEDRPCIGPCGGVTSSDQQGNVETFNVIGHPSKFVWDRPNAIIVGANLAPFLSFSFASRQGSYGQYTTRITNAFAVDLSLDLGSYNQSTDGQPYWSRGIEVVGELKWLRVGFQYTQTSNDGGFSWSSSADNFSFWDVMSTSEGLSIEFAPPQAFSGVSVTITAKPPNK
jgi:RHS repeat-associated protein